MFRHASMALVCALIISSVLLAVPVNAEDDAGPDTSGYDYDIGRFFTRLLDNPEMAVSFGPPRYQWDAERYMDEGDRCAEKYKEYHTRFIDRGYVVYQQVAAEKGYTPLDKPSFSRGIFTDSDGVIIGDVLNAKDPEATRAYQLMDAYGSCVQKNYDAALDMQTDDDYTGKAAVWDRAAQMFGMLGNDKRAEESRNRADEYREAADTKSLLDALFQPVPAWLVIPGIAVGWFLMRRKRA